MNNEFAVPSASVQVNATRDNQSALIVFKLSEAAEPQLRVDMDGVLYIRMPGVEGLQKVELDSRNRVHKIGDIQVSYPD